MRRSMYSYPLAKGWVQKISTSWRNVMIAIPFFWLLVFFLAPFLIVLKISFAESLIASPPFSSLLEILDDGTLIMRLAYENYSYLWEDPLYVRTYLNSIRISTISTILCLLIGYPMAYAIVR